MRYVQRLNKGNEVCTKVKQRCKQRCKQRQWGMYKG